MIWGGLGSYRVGHDWSDLAAAESEEQGLAPLWKAPRGSEYWGAQRWTVSSTEGLCTGMAGPTGPEEAEGRLAWLDSELWPFVSSASLAMPLYLSPGARLPAEVCCEDCRIQCASHVQSKRRCSRRWARTSLCMLLCLCNWPGAHYLNFSLLIFLSVERSCNALCLRVSF